MTEKFDGYTVIVTGAASGLGEGTAVAFAEAGARVFAVDRDLKGLEALRERLSGAGTPPVLHVADIADPEQCEATVAAAVATFGGCAGQRRRYRAHGARGRYQPRFVGAHACRQSRWNVLPVSEADPKLR